jgi:hypothetical protein
MTVCMILFFLHTGWKFFLWAVANDTEWPLILVLLTWSSVSVSRSMIYSIYLFEVIFENSNQTPVMIIRRLFSGHWTLIFLFLKRNLHSFSLTQFLESLFCLIGIALNQEMFQVKVKKSRNVSFCVFLLSRFGLLCLCYFGSSLAHSDVFHIFSRFYRYSQKKKFFLRDEFTKIEKRSFLLVDFYP